MHAGMILLKSACGELLWAKHESWQNSGSSETTYLFEILLRAQTYYDRVKAANSVLIIGGGPVGVETAGEIMADFPGMFTKSIISLQGLRLHCAERTQLVEPSWQGALTCSA